MDVVEKEKTQLGTQFIVAGEKSLSG